MELFSKNKDKTVLKSTTIAVVDGLAIGAASQLLMIISALTLELLN